MKEDRIWAILKRTEEKVRLRLPNDNPLHGIHFVPINDSKIGVYIFYHHERDVFECDKSGLTQIIKDSFDAEFNRPDTGFPGKVSTCFEVDSHENVLKNFRGNYLFRLR